MNFRKLSILFATILMTASMATAKEEVRVASNRVVYEVFVRNFSATSSKVGTLKGVEAQIPRLKALGVDVVWLMPIYLEGGTDHWGTYSSPYAVKDYYKIDPKYGTDADLKSLVKTIHDNGMLIWLDWVANHTATDAVWLTEHPDYYVKKNGEFYHPSGWSDVYELEYNSKAMRTNMIDAMKYWVREFDIDGYRLDNTDGVPNDFWKECRTAVDSYAQELKGKPLEWLAETGGNPNYGGLTTMSVFDCNYAWSYNDRLLEVGTSADVAKLKSQSAALHSDATYRGKTRMVYLTNHDVMQDKDKGTPDKYFGSNLKAMTVLEFTIYGMPLIYNGQEIKYSTGKQMLSEKYPINWSNPDNSVTELITKLCYLKHTEPALRTGAEGGSLINHDASNGNVYVYERRRDNHSVVVMLNLGNGDATFTVDSRLPGNTYTETFTGSTQNFGDNNTFTLPAHGYAVWTKGDEPLVTNDVTYTITLYRPSHWSNTPHAHVYYKRGNVDTDLITNTEMERVGEGVYRINLVNPPTSGGYTVMFNNGGWSGGQSSELTEETPGNYEYDIDGTNQLSRRQSGIESLTPDADNVQYKYFDIYGREVANPTQGLYIRSDGKKIYIH